MKILKWYTIVLIISLVFLLGMVATSCQPADYATNAPVVRSSPVDIFIDREHGYICYYITDSIWCGELK